MIFFYFFFLGTVSAQDFSSFLRPGPSSKQFSFQEHFYSNAKVSGSDRKLQQRQWQTRASAPAWSDGKQEITLSVDASDLVLHHPSPVLNPYRSFQGTVGWRYYGNENKVRGFSLGYGSASDRPFESSSNNFLNINYLHQFNEKWWGAVNYSNNRNFANGIPLPGFFYAAKMSREETLLLGLPFLFWRKRYASGFDVQANALFPWNYRAQAGYYWTPFTGLSLAYEHRPQQYFRNDRDHKKERLFYREQKLSLVLNGAIIPRVLQWQVESGYAFNRSFFEAKNFSGRKRFDIPVDDSWFVAINVNSNF
jgi:hypothetical protein